MNTLTGIININEIRGGSGNRFYFFVFVFLVTIFLRLALGVNIPVLVFLMLSLYPIFMCGLDEQLAFIVCCIPFIGVFQYRYALMLCATSFILKNKGTIRLNSIGVTILIMMIWEFLHIFLGDFSFVAYFQNFAELIMLLFISTANLKVINYKMIIRAFALATVGVCIIMLYLQLQQENFNFLSLLSRGFQNYRFGFANTNLENFGLNYNANQLGFTCNLAISGILLLFSRKEQSKFDFVILIVASMFSLFTLSRAAIICIILLYAGFMLAMPGNVMERLTKIISLAFAAIVGFFLINKYAPQIFEYLIARFSEADITNGRAVLFSIYNEFIWSSPMFLLFGVGIQDYLNKVGDYVTVSNVSHNGYQEIWVVWGLVGIILFAVLFIGMLKISRGSSGKPFLVQYAPFVLILVYILSSQFISSGMNLLSLVFAYICLSIAGKKTDFGEIR